MKQTSGIARTLDDTALQGETNVTESGQIETNQTPPTGADREWPVEQRGIMISGENPMIVLYRSGTDEVVAIASVWTSRYSPVGQGRALIIWCDPVATGLGERAPIGIFADNPELASYVWDNFYNDYEAIQGRGVEDASLRHAVFSETSGGSHFHRITCTAGSTIIDLEWRDVLEVFHSVTYPTGYEVSLVAAPCAGGAIIVDGTAASGEIHAPEGWFHSTSLLAYAETWIALPQG